jgi:hypothetical protein
MPPDRKFIVFTDDGHLTFRSMWSTLEAAEAERARLRDQIQVGWLVDHVPKGSSVDSSIIPASYSGDVTGDQ